MKTQKGITLIALIITIIVMLILVGVSVSVALNTGLFKTAQGAAKNTQIAADEENTLSTGMITVRNSTTGELEPVDINSFGKTEEGPAEEEPEEPVYTHKVTFTYGEDSFECNIKEDTTFNQLASQHTEITVDENGKVRISDQYVWYCTVTSVEAGGDGRTEYDLFKGNTNVMWLLLYLDNLALEYVSIWLQSDDQNPLDGPSLEYSIVAI